MVLTDAGVVVEALVVVELPGGRVVGRGVVGGVKVAENPRLNVSKTRRAPGAPMVPV